MAFAVKSFRTLIQEGAAAIQARSTVLVSFTKGSILRAVLEAQAAVVIWLESFALYILALTRASTSEGEDLDSWMADYNFARLGAQKAAGFVTYSRLSPTAAGLVPVGSISMTADRTQRFVVLADTTHSAYDAEQDGYAIPAGVYSIVVPVQAATAGEAGNVVAGAVSVMYGSATGIDDVVNDTAMTGGLDAESDLVFMQRFWLYIAGLSRAVEAAIGSAIKALGLGLQYQIVNNKTPNGADRAAFFYVVVDDGTGTPSDALVALAVNAVTAVRACGISFTVLKPTIVQASVSMTLVVASGYDANTLKGLVAVALTTYINTLPLGASLSYNRLAQIAFDVSPGITNVTSVRLNSATADITATPRQVIKALSVSVN